MTLQLLPPSLMWNTSNASGGVGLKYEDVANAGPPAAPLAFPAPQIKPAKRVLVAVEDHVSGLVHHEKEVILACSERGQSSAHAYLMKKCLSQCTHGVVRLAIVLERNVRQDETRDCPEAEWRSTNNLVCIKVLSSDCLRQHPSSSSSHPLHEISALQLVGSYHVNVLGCVEALQDEEELFIVTPYKHGKDLYHKLMGSNRKARSSRHPSVLPIRKPSKRVAKGWFRDLLQGLSHLQNKGICHRNLSLENLLLDSDGRLVIADFGFALRVPYTDWRNFGGIADVSEGSTRRLIVATGHGDNLNYLAPELHGMPFDGFAVDMWSAGVILFVLLVGRAPFRSTKGDDAHYQAIARKGQLGPLLQSLNIDIDKEAVDLLQNLLWEDPRLRLNLQDALAHPWLTLEEESDDALMSSPVRFDSSGERKDRHCRMVTIAEESLAHLSLHRMASF